MKAYRYVIRFDAGSAPNYDRPATTLAICKPGIRRSAAVGDLVLAFSGSNLSPEPHSVRWAGIVSEKLSFAEYWRDRRFSRKKPQTSARPDNIYRPINGALVQMKNCVHDERGMVTDIGGKFVLVFERAWQFGSAAPILPAAFGLRMVGGRRGHRVVDLSNKQWAQVEKWLDAQALVTTIYDTKDSTCTGKKASPGTQQPRVQRSCR